MTKSLILTLLHKTNTIRFLIKRGGGTGPVKPGNRCL